MNAELSSIRRRSGRPRTIASVTMSVLLSRSLTQARSTALGNRTCAYVFLRGAANLSNDDGANASAAVIAHPLRALPFEVGRRSPRSARVASPRALAPTAKQRPTAAPPTRAQAPSRALPLPGPPRNPCASFVPDIGDFRGLPGNAVSLVFVG